MCVYILCMDDCMRGCPCVDMCMRTCLCQLHSIINVKCVGIDNNTWLQLTIIATSSDLVC